MVKKIFNIAILCIAITVLASCTEEDDYTPPFGNFSSLTWWSSPAGQFSLTEKGAPVNSYIAFKDLSRGVLTHEWTIGPGASFLRSGFDESETDYTPFKIAGTSTENTLAFVLFEEPGVTEVRLINTFKDSVPEAVNENGVWKVNKLFTITVTEQ